GVVVTQFCSSCTNDVVKGLLVQPDGRIVAVGHSLRAGGFAAGLARYNRDGSVDTTFGEDGRVTTPTGKESWANAVVLHADGRFVTAGITGPTTGSGDFALVRYQPDAAVDATFGDGGVVTTSFSNLPR